MAKNHQLLGAGASGDHVSQVVCRRAVMPVGIQCQCKLLYFVDTVLYKWLQFLVSLQPVQYNLTQSKCVF